MSDSSKWIELSVCETCLVMVGGAGEIHSDSDQRSADAIARYVGYHMWVDCTGDCEDRPDSHECAGGFTHLSCDLCGESGRDDYRVIADPVEPDARIVDDATPPRLVKARALNRRDVIVSGDCPLGKVEAIDHSPSHVYARIGHDNYHFFNPEDSVMVRFAFA